MTSPSEASRPYLSSSPSSRQPSSTSSPIWNIITISEWVTSLGEASWRALCPSWSTRLLHPREGPVLSIVIRIMIMIMMKTIMMTIMKPSRWARYWSSWSWWKQWWLMLAVMVAMVRMRRRRRKSLFICCLTDHHSDHEDYHFEEGFGNDEQSWW